MEKTPLKLTALLGLFLLPFTAFAEEPIQSLNKMSQAMRDLNYEIAFCANYANEYGLVPLSSY